MKKKIPDAKEMCSTASIVAVKDALETLNGSWKLQILMALSDGPRRFKQISKEVVGITDRMLSKELKDLEAHHLVIRTVYDTFPPTVEYAKTDHAASLYTVMMALRDWGILHRKKVLGK